MFLVQSFFHKKIVEFPISTHERPYDPLMDHDVLEMLREWYKSGEAVVFPKDVECYRAHRDAVEALSDKDVEELGLKFPCHMIRSPATEASQKVDEFRIRLGVWEMRTTNIIIGAWLFNRDVDRDTLQQLMPNSNFDRMIPKLVEGGLVTIRGNGRIVPSRLLLYREMEQVVWAVSRVALAKENVSIPKFEHRIAILEEVAAEYKWLQVRVTDSQLLADIAVGYDLLVMGADKWHQIQDPIFYGGDAALRDSALARLPELAIVPREPFEAPPTQELRLPQNMNSVSSSAARDGLTSLMLGAAKRFDELTGAWTDTERYELWLTGKTD